MNLALLAYGADELPDLGKPLPDNCEQVIAVLFPRTEYTQADPVSLDTGWFPDRETIRVAKFDGGLLLATRDAALFNPTKLNKRYLKPKLGATVALLTQQSTHDMFAFSRWRQGTLVRSLSVNPVGGVWETVGRRERWETPFWNGERAVDSEYPLPFHPLDLSDTALRHVLRLHVDGAPDEGLVDPSTVILQTYTRVSGADP